MMKITRVEKQCGGETIKLEGKLAGPWVAELESLWASLAARPESHPLQVDLLSVSFVDESGKELLARMHRSGAELLAGDCLTCATLAEIGAAPKEQTKRHAPDAARNSALALFLASLATLSGALAAHAQEKPEVRLTLQEAVQLALKQNPQVQISALAVAQSEQDRSIARAGLLPQAKLAISDRVQRLNIEAEIGKKFPGLGEHGGPFEVFQAGSDFSMPILDLALWRRWQAARRGVEASAAERNGIREQVVLLVVSQYLGCLRSAANVRAAQSRVELAEALYEQASDLQKNGAGTGIDTLRANVELQNENQRLIVARTQRQTALYGLARLLNLDPRQEVELGDELSFFETPDYDAGASIERALADRPEMKALEARDQRVRAEEQAVSESRLPALRFGGNWTQEGLSAATIIPTYSYALALEMPLFTGGRMHAELARENLELQKIEQERQDLRDQIALEVKTAIAQLESARHEVEVASLGVQLARAEVDQARDRFQAGVTNNIEVITAQDELARANDNQIGALYRYNQARADLGRATGRMESLYGR